MAISPSFFNKREPVVPPTRPPSTPNGNSYGPSGTPAPLQAAPPAVASPPSSVAPVAERGSKLTVGPNIKLKGVEITDCDTLLVEGLVEATMDSRVIQISEQGAFKGSAGVDIAEIHGRFDGDLTVRQKLMIYSTGKVTGKIRYGKVVIEEGGQVTGDIQFGALPVPQAGRQEQPGLSVAG